MSVCKERWFEILDVLPRPLTRWGFGALAVAYGVRAVAGLSFDASIFGALATAAGFTYATRGVEKIMRSKT